MSMQTATDHGTGDVRIEERPDPAIEEPMRIVATHDEERHVSEGDLIVFSPGEEHWHGNKPDSEAPFSHMSFIAQTEGAEPTVLD